MGDPQKPLKAITMEDKRFGYCNAKTLNLMPAVLYAQAAAQANAYETILHRDGVVTECAHSNISILKNGKLLTHPEGRYILSGIARKRLIFTCRTLKIPVEERPFTVKELLQADEIFITSTTKLCQRAGSLMGRSIGLKDERRAFSILNEIFTHFSSCDIAQ
jgi:D-alanine transaminase